MTGQEAERQQLRDYQTQCLEQAKSENIILHLGTGLGKTLVALRLIEHYLERQENKLAVIIVPTVVIVEQHAKSCREQIGIGDARKKCPRVLEIAGNNQAGWSREDWLQAIDDHDIFVSTPDIFRKALVTNGYLRVDNFSVIVFDECHHAINAGSMATILHDAVHCDVRHGPPRVLGLTASFVKGGLGNAANDRRQMEMLFRARFVCPDVESQSKPKPRRIAYGNDMQHTKEDVLKLKQLLSVALGEVLIEIKDMKKAINQCTEVFKELGRESLVYYVKNIVKQIEYRISQLQDMEEQKVKDHAAKMAERLPILKRSIESLKTSLFNSGLLENQTSPRTSKLERLLTLLQERFDANTNNGFCGIVFVAEVSLVPTLAKQLNDGLSGAKCGGVTGGSAQSMSDRRENIDAFRKGHYRLLVATAALEEGIDVPQCRFAVQFSKSKTTKSIIQTLGRVRHVNAEHYYFENNPEIEKHKVERLVAFARDSSLSLSAEERSKAPKKNAGNNQTSLSIQAVREVLGRCRKYL